MSCCLSSSRLKMTRRFGRCSFSMSSTNFLPKDPVPPVTRTTCSDQFIHPPHKLYVESDAFEGNRGVADGAQCRCCLQSHSNRGFRLGLALLASISDFP